MVDVEFIKLRCARDGWSIRETARRTGWSRQAIRKALAAPAAAPRYERRSPRAAPVMDPYLPFVRQWLTNDESAPRKQRHTARRVYDRLVAEHGFCGSEVTVRRAVARLRGKRLDAYVPLEAPFGRIAQADFGSAVVTIAGVRTEVALFCLRAKASKVPFVVAYPNERLEAFLAGHVEAFAFFGGVFAELWYDNAKTAVAKILAGPAREEHERLSALRAHFEGDLEGHLRQHAGGLLGAGSEQLSCLREGVRQGFRLGGGTDVEQVAALVVLTCGEEDRPAAGEFGLVAREAIGEPHEVPVVEALPSEGAREQVLDVRHPGIEGSGGDRADAGV